MADKTTTLKTKTNDNVYPKVIGESRKDSFADSSTITHHFYDKTHKVGFQIANETNIKIQNSLQKPSGLTKTKLVGVGTNGQENIEIGDNLTLANGKLSATGGGSGGEAFDVITLSSDETTYTGTITGERPVIIKVTDTTTTILPIQNYVSDMAFAFTYELGDGDSIYINLYLLGGGQVQNSKFKIFAMYYSHFITITSSTSTFYFTYQNTSNEKIITLDSLKTALSGKYLLCTGHTDSDTAEYIYGENGNIVVGVVDNSDHSTSGITIDSSYTITDLVSPVE